MKKQNKPTSSALSGLTPGLRMRGGVRYDPANQQYYAIVHSWDNPLATGAAQEWRSEQGFSTEAAALSHYQTVIRPQLEGLMRGFQQSSGRIVRRELE